MVNQTQRIMEKKIEMYRGDMIATYQETEEKKQKLWDAFIEWCKKHNSSTGESTQNDDFNIDAPEFIADCIDDIIEFKTEWKD
jgi:hypothetical protein